MARTYPGFGLTLLFTLLVCFIQPTSAEEETVSERVLEEVLVTAQRRGPERLQDVPMSVSVIDEELIRRNGMVEMNDYLRALPSTNFIDQGPGRNNVIIRGVTTDAFWDDTVGIYIGDTPVSNLGAHASGSPDLKLVDVSRVEVLRGPQGTLYGEGSIGGTVRIIPATPNPERFEAQIKGSLSTTAGEGDNNNTAEGMVNLPLLDGDAALRLVAYRHDNSGYYRNVAGSDPDIRYWAEVFGVPAVVDGDIGATVYEGWRAQLLWQPNSDLSITLMALGQDIEESGLGRADPGLGNFQQIRLNDRDGNGDQNVMDFDLTSLEVSYDMGPLSLLSTTSLVESWAGGSNHAVGWADFLGVGAIPIFNRWLGPAESFTQELRITSRQDQRFRYLAGYFYQDLDSWVDNITTYEGDPAMDPVGGATILDALGEFDLQQQALFGEVSFDITDRLSASAGFRWYEYEETIIWSGYGLAAGLPEESDSAVDLTTAEDDGDIYSLSLNYEASDTTRVYASLNQGFRFGGPHPTLPPGVCDVDGDGIVDGTDLPQLDVIASDEVDSYELGAKYRSADGRVSMGATVFRLYWDGIPVWVPVPCGFPYWAPAGKGETQGIEIEGQWAFADGWLLAYAASWLDPTLTEDAIGIGEAGDRLPGSPLRNLNLGIERDFTIRGREAFVRADLVNVGEYFSDVQKTLPPLGDYTTIGLRGGVGFDDLQVEIYVHNLTDEFVQVFNCCDFYNALRPRTIGIQLTYQYRGR
jgi:outer membrane receptor protein involved in Fe transport